MARIFKRNVVANMAGAQLFSGGAWSPAELFQAGEQGCVYDPSDLSTCWKDIGATDPVTADGDQCSRIDDLSGNGNNAETILPITWQAPGFIKHVTTSYSLPAAVETAASDNEVWIGCNFDGASCYVVSGGADRGLTLLSQDSQGDVIRPFAAKTPGAVIGLGTTVVNNGALSFSWGAAWERATDRLQSWVDAAQEVDETGANPGSNLNSDNITIGSRGSGTGIPLLHWWGMVRIDRLLTDAERAQVRAWLDARKPAVLT